MIKKQKLGWIILFFIWKNLTISSELMPSPKVYDIFSANLLSFVALIACIMLRLFIPPLSTCIHQTYLFNKFRNLPALKSYL